MVKPNLIVFFLTAFLLAACTKNESPEEKEAVEPKASIQCGAILNENFKLDGRLQCKSEDKIGLIISGDNLIIDGSNFDVEALDAEIGLLVLGNNNLVKNFKISGLKNGTAVLIFENSNVIISNNTLIGNAVGIDVYNKDVASNSIVVTNNNVADSYIGLRIRDEGSKKNNKKDGQRANEKTNNPIVKYNDFSRAKLFGLQVLSDEFVLSGDDENIFLDSANGLFLQGRNVKLENIDMSTSRIYGTVVFAFDVQFLNLIHMNLSADQVIRDSNGLHLYRIGSAQIDELSITNRDVGIKLATDSGVESQFYLNKSDIRNSKSAALMVQSYDETIIDTVKVQETTFQNNPDGYDLWIVAGTIVKNQ